MKVHPLCSFAVASVRWNILGFDQNNRLQLANSSASTCHTFASAATPNASLPVLVAADTFATKATCSEVWNGTAGFVDFGLDEPDTGPGPEVLCTT